MLEHRICFFVSNVLWVIPTSKKCVTLMGDLKIQGHMIFNVIFHISASTHARAVEIGIGHVQNDITLNFKVICYGPTYGSKWNEFPDPYNIRNKQTIFEKSCVEAEIHLIMVYRVSWGVVAY